MGVKIDELFWELDLKSQKLHDGIDRAEKRLGKFVQFIKAHPVAVLGALGAALTLAGIAAAKFAEQIDRHLRRVDALIPKTTQGVDKMRQRLLDLARATPVPLEELAAGLEHVVATGEKHPDQIFHRLAQSARLAQLAGTDLNSAIEILDHTMDAFELPAEATTKVLEVFATAVQHGTPIAELAPILEQVQAKAANAGVDLAELVTAISTLNEAGIPARQVTGALKEAFGDLADGATTAGATQSALGVKISVVDGKLQFAGRSATDYAATLDAMSKSTGTADAMLRRLGGATEEAAKAQNRLKIQLAELGQKVLPLAVGGLTALNDLIDRLTGHGAEANTRQLTNAGRQFLELAEAARQARAAGDGGDLSGPVNRARIAFSEFYAQLRKGTPIAGLTIDEMKNLGKEMVKLARDPAQVRALLERFDLSDADATRIAQAIVYKLNRAIARETAAAAGQGTMGDTKPKGPPPLTPEQLQRQAQIRQQLATQLAGLTTSLVDDLEARLNALLADINQLPEHVRGQFASGIARLKAEISAARPLEQLDKDLEAIEQRVNQITDAFGEVPATLGLEILPSVQELIAQLQTARDGQARGTVLWNTYNDRLTKAVELSKKLVKNVGSAGDGQQDLNAELDKTLDKLELQASRIQSAVRGAIQLGEAFGLLDDQAAAMLQNITQIATEIPKVAAVLKSGGGLEKALPGLLGIAGGIAGLLGGLFGRTDPEEERRKEILRENTDAIRKLTERIGEAFVDVSGAQFAGAREAAERALQNRQVRNILEGNESTISGRRRRERERAAGAIQREFAAAGISMAELRDIAEELGLAFAGAIPTARELKQLAEALASTELTRFAQTFAGQIDLLSREFELFDISDPIDQLQRLREIALGFADSPLITALFGGLDLSTPAGRAALEERIRDIYRQLQAGTLTPEQIGGLTPQQLLELLSQLETTMDQVAEGIDQGRTAQFEVRREVTETTAGRLVSLGVTSLLWLEEIARNTRGLAPALQPPSAAALAAYAGAGSGVTITGPINITVQAGNGVSAGEAESMGRAVARGLRDELDREFGTKLRQRALLQGSVTRN
jgi:hypothetical protein